MIIYIKKCQSANDLEIIDISPNNSSAFWIGCRSDNKSRAMRQNIRTPKGILQSQVIRSCAWKSPWKSFCESGWKMVNQKLSKKRNCDEHSIERELDYIIKLNFALILKKRYGSVLFHYRNFTPLFSYCSLFESLT